MLPLVGTLDEQRRACQEIHVLSMAAKNCSRACLLYGVCVKEEKICLVMKLYRGSLRQLLNQLPGAAIDQYVVCLV